jgi:RNA polymerase primary sigma factor
MGDDHNTDDRRRALAQLSEKEIKVLRDRFGIDPNDDQTLEAVGRNFFRTRSRIRQIEERVLRKLGKKGDPDDAA